MDNEAINPIDALFDEDNNDPILLYNQNGEAISFEQIAIIPLKSKVYAILKPVQPIDGLGEDEGLVFVIEQGENDAQDYLTLVTDEKIIDDVFEIYDDLIESEK
ncbi:MAG: DUF1292 domain-containing protein [Clostridia bacterium]|nr:DUF1292 domain-containing protein [Clostridia bacterium]